MILLAKMAIGLTASLAVAGAWVFHEGVIRVDVDEHRDGGSHLHFWVPATAVSTGLHLTPRKHLREAATQARPYLPLLREIAKELQKYPEAEFVDVVSSQEHVRISIHGGKLGIDVVTEEGDVVHVTVPAHVLSDVADGLESEAPGV